LRCRFNDSVLLKQEGAPLRIVNVCSGQERTVSDFASPGALIFLHERAAFLAVHGDTLATFDCRGAKTTRFADHTLWHADGCVTNNTTFVTNDQTAVVSFCKPADDADTTGAGAVHVSDVVTCVLMCAVLRGACVDAHLLAFTTGARASRGWPRWETRRGGLR
jgi:hypothetical protein